MSSIYCWRVPSSSQLIDLWSMNIWTSMNNARSVETDSNRYGAMHCDESLGKTFKILHVLNFIFILHDLMLMAWCWWLQSSLIISCATVARWIRDAHGKFPFISRWSTFHRQWVREAVSIPGYQNGFEFQEEIKTLVSHC